MKKYKKALIPALAAAAITAAAVAVLIMSAYKTRQTDFDSAKNLIDRELSMGFYVQAEKICRESENLVYTGSAAMELLARYNRIADETGNFDAFYRYSCSANEKYPRNPEIAAARSWTEYKTGRFKDALKTAEGSGLDRSDYNTLYLLSALKNGEKPANRKSVERLERGLSVFFKPELWKDPYAMAEAAKKTGSTGLAVNAGLLMMKNGLKAEACAVFDGKAAEDYPEAATMVFYDSGEYSSALDNLERTEARYGRLDGAMSLVKADLLYSVGAHDEAEVFIERFIRENPSYSWVPYRNMFMLENGNEKYLEAGLEYFPDNMGLMLPLARVYAGRGEDSALVELLERMEKAAPGDPDAGMLRLSMEIPERSPEYITGRMWEIVEGGRESRDNAVSFAYYLASVRDYKQLLELLERYEKRNGPESWIYEYRAAALAASGMTADAEAAAAKMLAIEESPETLYNAAVVKSAAGKAGEASLLIMKAAGMCDESGYDPYTESRVYLAAAKYRLAEGNAEASAGFLEKYNNTGEVSVEAGLLRKKLERYYD